MPDTNPSLRSPCPIACALDLLGDRWTLLVIRDLFVGKSRFEDFLKSPEGIATNILANRLRNLEARGIVEKIADEADRRRSFYQLTPAGTSLHEVIVPLARWGMKFFPGTRVMDAAEKYVRSNSRS